MFLIWFICFCENGKYNFYSRVCWKLKESHFQIGWKWSEWYIIYVSGKSMPLLILRDFCWGVCNFKNMQPPYIILKNQSIYSVCGSFYRSRDIKQNGPKIMSPKPTYFVTLWTISWGAVHIFQKGFLRWKRESELVDLNNPNKLFHL